jgi:NADPH:quinone reductase-like Zn-dependent oxidoreductase
MVEKQEGVTAQEQFRTTSTTLPQKSLQEIPMFMTACVVNSFNADTPLQGLSLQHNFKAPQTLKSDEVLVKMNWSSLNQFDYYMLTGKLPVLTDLPCIPGRDGCGQVVMLGEESSRFFNLHDWVLGATTNWKYGTFGQYSVFKWSELCRKPEGLSVEHAAALPVVLLSAFQCFQKIPDPKSLKRILIHGGSGGVGSMCILLAKYYYNIQTVISTCRGTNCDYVKGLGADEVINYNEVDWETFILNKYPKDQDKAVLDCVIDPVGGDVMLDKSYKLLDKNGYYITTVPMRNIDPRASDLKDVIGFGVQFLTQKFKSVFTNSPAFHSIACSYDGEQLRMLTEWISKNGLHDKIQVIKYQLSGINTALEQISCHHTDGKLIVDMTF